MNKIQSILEVISGNKLFQMVVMLVIIVSALAIGVKSHNITPEMQSMLLYFDWAVTIFFAVEITMRLLAEKTKLNFFKSGWNVFDFIIVVASLIPVDDNEMVLLGRLLRVFRVLRLISYVPELRMLINTLLIAIPKMGYVALLMFIIFYIYAAFGNMFYENINKDLWGDISISLLTLFRVATFEDWTDIMYETMVVHPMSWIYYITFIFLGSFVFLNMMVGIVIDSFAEERDKMDGKDKGKVLADQLYIKHKLENMDARFDQIEEILKKKK